MVKPQDTRKVQAELREAGFVPTRRQGSHTTWSHPDGVRVSVPDGHRSISAGVYRSVRQAIEKAKGWR